jgi:RimJ/RimL family protein N-acetyltransferase
MDVVLETERLVLRKFSEADVDLLFALDADPEVTRFINGGKPTPREVIQNEIIPGILRYYETTPGFGRWAVVERASGAFLGWLSLRRWTEGGPGEAVLGYRLRRAAWGQGYATEGARAVIRRAFADLGIQRIVAHTMTVNTGSRRVMDKSGMSLVRTFFGEWPEVIEGSEHGDVEYALTRADWERHQTRDRTSR